MQNHFFMAIVSLATWSVYWLVIPAVVTQTGSFFSVIVGGGAFLATAAWLSSHLDKNIDMDGLEVIVYNICVYLGCPLTAGLFMWLGLM